MKRLSGFLAVTLIFALLLGIMPFSAAAYTTVQYNTADALNQLGLFLGTGTSYALDDNLTREQGIVLLVRMLGMERKAMSGSWKHPFPDVPEWVSPYVGFAYEEGLTNGISATEFGGGLVMTDQMFLTLCLRAIGYSDINGGSDFTYNNVWSFAESLGLINSTKPDSCFSRGETVMVFWRLLNLHMKDTRKTLSERLIGQGVFTKVQWQTAVYVQANGRCIPEEPADPDPIIDPEEPSPTPHAGSDIETPRF